MTATTLPITAVVLTFNEEKNIGACLGSIADVEKVFVVDSGSTDRTIEICEAHGARVVGHSYLNHASQWQWALDNLPIETDWVLALDADFVVTSELLGRVARDIGTLPPGVNGIYVRHIYRFAGGLIRFGGTKQFWLRLVRRGAARPDTGDLVDFRFVIDGKVLSWGEAVIEYNRNDDDVSVWSRKQDKFALRLAAEEELRRRGLHGWSGRPRLLGTVDERFAWLRDRWLTLPLFLRPTFYFFYRYFLTGGFLDGRAGFLYAALQGFWLRLIVDMKTTELRALALDDQQLLNFAKRMLDSQSGSVAAVQAMTKASHPRAGE